MRKKKAIISDYKKRMEEINDVVMRTRTRLMNQNKKQTVRHLRRLGESEFDTLELLEKLNDISIKCHKCGSTLACNRC